MIELRPPDLADLDCYFEIFSDQTTHHYIIDEGRRTREQSLEKLKLLVALNGHEKIVYTICAAHQPVGFIVIHVDGSSRPFISYAVRRSHWRKGYAGQALALLIRIQATKFDGLQAAAHLDNAASQTLLAKAGF